MTQAYNLSQLANNLTSNGQLDAADGLVNAVPLANGGTGATTASAARTNLGVAAAIFAVPTGGIIMWSGSAASIPAGWALCDGNNSTPNLTNRFVVGAGGSYSVGASGGSKDAIVVSHTHTASTTTTIPNHKHDLTGGFGEVPDFFGGSGNGYGVGIGSTQSGYDTATASLSPTSSTTVNSSGSSGTDANLPPYYALCFIMKT
jgi:microcystin-dependent protein